MMRARCHHPRGQSMVEFALISPVLFLLIFGIVDFGRVVYVYNMLDQAVNEGGRVAIRAPAPPNPDIYAPNDAAVIAAVKSAAPGLALTTPTCVNGPISSSSPPVNSGWIYITEPGGSKPAGSSPANTPGGQTGSAPAGCDPLVPAGVTPGQTNVPLQITIQFNFQPMTPLIGSVTGNQIVISAYAAYRTEY